jgi:hypothetical protein
MSMTVNDGTGRWLVQAVGARLDARRRSFGRRVGTFSLRGSSEVSDAPRVVYLRWLEVRIKADLAYTKRCIREECNLVLILTLTGYDRSQRLMNSDGYSVNSICLDR